MKLNFKIKNFLQYQLEFYQEKKISLSARELYSFIYRHCIDFHNQGWCGFSNDKLAEKLNTTTRTIERSLKELTEKEMIIIENTGRRTKKPGQSREIYINAKNYIANEVLNVKEPRANSEIFKLVEQLKKDNEELQLQLNKANYELAKTAHITELGKSLIKTGFISEEQYRLQSDELNHILLDFESWHKEGRDLTKACFNHWNNHKDSYIKNPVQYTPRNC